MPCYNKCCQYFSSLLESRFNSNLKLMQIEEEVTSVGNIIIFVLLFHVTVEFTFVAVPDNNDIKIRVYSCSAAGCSAYVFCWITVRSANLLALLHSSRNTD